METMRIRGASVALPGLDPDELVPVQTLRPDDGRLSLFSHGGAELRALELTRTQLFDGRISDVSAERVGLDHLRMSSVEIAGCDLASMTLSNSRLSRVRFTNCRLLGARFEDLVLDNVVFERCKIDYATLSGVIAKGPVLFVGCSLAETEIAGCDLSGAAFEDCILRATSFLPGGYAGTDLRGNDLSAIVGAVNLKRIVIDRHQLTDLAVVVADELGITVADGV